MVIFFIKFKSNKNKNKRTQNFVLEKEGLEINENSFIDW